jgi:hypothetical protein
MATQENMSKRESLPGMQIEAKSALEGWRIYGYKWKYGHQHKHK